MSGGLMVLVLPLIALVLMGAFIARAPGKRKRDDAVADEYQPTVTVITPMFNEGAGIRHTIRSIVAQDYPATRLQVIIVDDCSTDDSYQHALDEAKGLAHVTVMRNDVNMGKRQSINRAVKATSSEIIVSVDSDVIIDRDAVSQLVRRFTGPKIAAVGGRVDIRNKDDNWLTRMQSVKYYFGYHFLKNLEHAFRAVMCLSGCLTAYRRSVLLELESILEHRNVLGVEIRYGEDRFLTRQIVKAGYETSITMDAVCRTLAPNRLRDYLDQQLRWRRSNIVDYFAGVSHVWRIHPLVAIHYYSLVGIFLAYPVILVQSLSAGTFWALMTAHLGIMAIFGVIYRIHVRKLPRDQRVAAADLLPLALIIPITYGLLVPVALMTLDSGKWETRGHEVPEAQAAEAGRLRSAPVDDGLLPAAMPESLRSASIGSRPTRSTLEV